MFKIDVLGTSRGRQFEDVTSRYFWSSGYRGYLVHFEAPIPKCKKKTYPEKISYIFSEKNFSFISRRILT